jgi:hypothetical protein
MKTKLLKRIRRNYRIVKEVEKGEYDKFYIEERWFNLPIWLKISFYSIEHSHEKVMSKFTELIIEKYRKPTKIIIWHRPEKRN